MKYLHMKKLSDDCGTHTHTDDVYTDARTHRAHLYVLGRAHKKKKKP